MKTILMALLLADISFGQSASVSALNYGADPTGASDSTAAINACVKYGFTVGLPCYLPGRLTATGAPVAQYKVATKIVLPDPGTSGNHTMGIVGDAPYINGGTPSAQGFGTQIICTQTHGPTGDPATGCIEGNFSSFSNPHLIFENFYMAGPDTPGSTTTSANGIMIHGLAVPVLTVRKVFGEFFLGLGTDVFWFDGPEDNILSGLLAAYSDGCAHLSGAFNDSEIIGFTCSHPEHDGWYIENSQSITFVGGSCQSAERTCAHLRGDLGVHFIGTHFEAVNLKGAELASSLWDASGKLFATLPTLGKAASAGDNSITLTGLGSGTIPFGSSFREDRSGRTYTTSAAATISGHAVTLSLTEPIPIAIPAGATIYPALTNKEGAIVEEAGYTGLGCDSHGLHCGFIGGYNENNSFRDVTMNVAVNGLTEFANPPGSDRVQYVNANTKIDLCAGSPNFMPLMIMDHHSIQTHSSYCGDSLNVIDPYALSNGDEFDSGAENYAPGKTLTSGPIKIVGLPDMAGSGPNVLSVNGHAMADGAGHLYSGGSPVNTSKGTSSCPAGQHVTSVNFSSGVVSCN